MKDLVCVVADKQIAATLDELLLRRRALGIRPVDAEILVHPHHDPGCYARPADLLRGYRQAAEHALIILDHAWEGVPAASGATLEALIDEKLEEAGMADWPSPSLSSPSWRRGSSALRPTSRTCSAGSRLVPHPRGSRRTESMGGRGREARRSEEGDQVHSSADGEEPFGVTLPPARAQVNTAGCEDRAFLRLKDLLRGWFPPVSPSGGGRPNGPSPGRTQDVEYETRTRKKLIEVALPLDDINAASAREKSIRHGHPSTLHLWWARRPLAAARAVIFAQMVDDPSAHPDLFPTEKAQEQERRRLFGIVRDLVKWENTTNEVVLERAREEIRENWRRTCLDNTDHPRAAELFDPDRLPAFHDPFAGAERCPWRRKGSGLKHTPAISTPWRC